MASVCFACANDFTPEAAKMRCCYCEEFFHETCTSLPDDIVASIKLRADVHWSCPGCTKALSNSRAKTLKDVGLQARFTKSIVTSLKDVIVEPLTAEVRSMLPTLIRGLPSPSLIDCDRPVPPQHHNTTPRPGRLSTESTNILAILTSQQVRAPGSFAAVVARSQKYARETISGSNTAPSPDLVATQDRRPPHFWLHIMGIAPIVTTAQLIASVQGRLDADDVIAFPLLGNGVDPASRHSLSFKVRIPTSCREKAFSPETWPLGVRVRDAARLTDLTFISTRNRLLTTHHCTLRYAHSFNTRNYDFNLRTCSPVADSTSCCSPPT
ncbi:putative nucleic acid binding protein [Anopheles sinensis]|uniref:Putative nucleic acid binding protein n=1 Tax=Anopheles sinensis TaxID=74873 RepID=A0A084VNI2_ANOSI|nr:putative nucleic acid binding protein [Anopheles sinensis]